MEIKTGFPAFYTYEKVELLFIRLGLNRSGYCG